MAQIEPGQVSGDFAEDATMPLPGAGEFGAPQIIGGFAGAPTATVPSIAPGWAQDVGFGRPHTVSGSFDPYHQGDEWNELKRLTTEDLTRLQQQMVALGLMSGKNVPYGEIDGGEDERGRRGTLGAMRQLMEMANRSGTTWLDTLNRIATNPDVLAGIIGDDTKPVFNFVSRDYLPTDPAEIDLSIRDLAKQMFRGTDIELSDEEVANLRGQFEGFLREQHFASEQQRLSEEMAGFEANVASSEGRKVHANVSAVPQVDAEARFRQVFEERMKPKTDAIEQMAVNDESRAVLAGSLGSVMQFATGR